MPSDALQAAAVGAVCAALIAACSGWPSRFLCGICVGLSIVAAFNAYTFERTFGAYVYDGTPVVGWPWLFATGQTSGGLAPVPPPPPDFHVYQDPYWLQSLPLKWSVAVSVSLSCAAGFLFARRLETGGLRTHWATRGTVWLGRCVALLLVTGLLLRRGWWHTDPFTATYSVEGTPLDRTLLWALMLLLLLPIAFPARRPILPAVGTLLDQWVPVSPLFVRPLATAALAGGFATIFLRAIAVAGECQHHYLTVPLTASLIAVAVALLLVGPRTEKD